MGVREGNEGGEEADRLGEGKGDLHAMDVDILGDGDAVDAMDVVDSESERDKGHEDDVKEKEEDSGLEAEFGEASGLVDQMSTLLMVSSPLYILSSPHSQLPALLTSLLSPLPLPTHVD